MKYTHSSYVILCSLGLSGSVLAQDQGFINSPQPTKAELKYGVEALTTWRSEYVYRGFELADNSMEFQLAGQVALSNTDTLDVGFYYGTASSDGDFSEAGAFIDFSRNIGDLTYSSRLLLRDYTNSYFKSGVDIGATVSWAMNDRVDLSSTLSYDTGAEGFYLEGVFSYYKELNEDAYFTVDTGLSAVANYYSRDGLNHGFAKMEFTYNINDAVSVSPYIKASLGIDDLAENHLMAGAYFAVSF